MNLNAMNLLPVTIEENDLMLIMVECMKSKEWPNGLAYILWENPIKKFKLSDQVAKAEKTAKLLSLKLKKGEDPSELELRIGLLSLNLWNSSEQGNEDCCCHENHGERIFRHHPK